jgi:hypothetical protein
LLDTGLHIAVDEARLKAIEDGIAKLLQIAEANAANDKPDVIGDFIHEAEVQRITRLGRTTLYNLRKQGVLSSSALVKGKGRFYRLSEIEELLYARQSNGK